MERRSLGALLRLRLNRVISVFIRHGRAMVSARTQTLVSTVPGSNPDQDSAGPGEESAEGAADRSGGRSGGTYGPAFDPSASPSRSPLKKNSGLGGGAVRPGSAAAQKRLKNRDIPLGELVAPAIFGEECLVPYIYPRELGGGEGPGGAVQVEFS